MYISGQIGFEPSTMEIVAGGVQAEADKVTRHICKNKSDWIII